MSSRSPNFRGATTIIDVVKDMRRPPLLPFDAWIGVGISAGSAAGKAHPNEYYEGMSPWFENAWVNVATTLDNARPRAAFYMSSDGEVRLRGHIRGGQAGTRVFQLPTGFRPEKTLQFIVPNDSGGHTTVEVQQDGSVVVLRMSGVTAIS